MGIMLWASFATAFVDIGLVLGLLVMYAQTYRSIKSAFTAGLLVFGILLVVLNLSIVTFWLYLFTLNIENIVETAATYLFLINTAQLVALAVLFRLTWKQ